MQWSAIQLIFVRPIKKNVRLTLYYTTRKNKHQNDIDIHRVIICIL